jgi:hypothetical protein
MRRTLLLFLVVSSVLAACNKEKRYERYLQGTWTSTMVRLQDYDGFTFFDQEPSGTLSFSGTTVKGSVICSFATFQGAFTDTLNLDANFDILLQDNELNWIQNGDTLKNRIFVLTRDNLEIEYYDVPTQKRYRYVFEKN